MATRKSQTAESETDMETQPQEDVREAVGAAGEAASEVTDTARESVEAVAESAGETREEVASSSDAVIDTVVISQQQAMEQAEASSQVMVDGVTRMQREIVDFVSERLRHDMRIQQELLRCRSFDEVRSVQARFFQTAMDQYSAEATKLMQMGQDIFQRSLARTAH
jgi:hypothetical protein